MDDKTSMQAQGLKWLYEMQLVGDTQLINNLKLNILSISKNIKEIEILTSSSHKAMLVYLELSFLGKLFYKKRLTIEVLDLLKNSLSQYRFRVTCDKLVFNQAVSNVKRALSNLPSGGENENTTDDPSDLPDNSSS